MSESSGTKEPQYNTMIDELKQSGRFEMGLHANASWKTDPRHLLFNMSRYKFVSKMFSGRQKVLEVGCGDAFGTRLVRQEVENVTVTDIDPIFINDINSRQDERWKLNAFTHNMLDGPIDGGFDGVYALDVIEHILPENEDAFLRNVIASMSAEGALIMGAPSLESQVYASPISKEGHVNCKSGKTFKAFFERYFTNVFVFSMNDEVVHTGYYPMAHYLFAVCTGIRAR